MCSTYGDDEILDFVQGRLSPEQAETLKGHLAACEACRVAVEELETIARLADAPALEPGPETDQKIRQLIARQATRHAAGEGRDRSRRRTSAARRPAWRRRQFRGYTPRDASVAARRASATLPAAARRPSRGTRARYGLPLAAAASIVLGLGVLLVWSSGRRIPTDRAASTGQQPGRSAVATKQAAGAEQRLTTSGEGGELATSSPLAFAPPEQVPPQLRGEPVPPQPKAPTQGSIVAETPPSSRPPARAPGTPEAELTEQPGTRSSVAKIARLTGPVRYARGAKGPWAKAQAGTALLAGDRLETRGGRARLTLEHGAELFINRYTSLRVLEARTDAGRAALIDLAKGEVFVTDRGRTIHVETADGLFSPMGTRFNVKRSLASTLVVVDQGAVDVRAKARKSRLGTPVDLRGRAWFGPAVRVEAGQQSRVRTGTAPQTPVTVNPSAATGWMLKSFVQTLALNDFESREDLRMFEHLAAQPERASIVTDHAMSGQRCLKLEVRPEWFRCLTAGSWLGLHTDWSGYTHFCVDIYNATDRLVPLGCNFRDQQGKAVLEKRNDRRVTLKPGLNRLRLRIEGMRTNDRTRPIDLGRIHMFLLCFDKSLPGTFYVDNIRLEAVK